ncbi:MAG TPA: M50 family metallopeptidase [Mycobacteriales bacterium]|nr:M50 family metallopeptidase [Mycobacteriales bacterium]
MSYTFGVVFFVVALLVSVMLHEAGHFLTAKRYGMKASRFFVGFGPTLWSTRRGETEYGVKAIPAGGFVKIIGMTELEDVAPGDEDRVFYKHPASQRLVVLSAGSIVHFIIAIVLLFLVIATTGDILKTTTTLKIGTVSKCLPLDPNAVTCTSKDPLAPASGKLRDGDRVIALDGRRLSSYDELRSGIVASPSRPVTLTVIRDGHDVDVTITPLAMQQDGRTIGRIGISPVEEQKPVSVLGAVPRTFSTLGEMTVETVKAFGQLPHEISQILRGEKRSTEGAASVVDIARVSGQIAEVKVSFGERLARLIALTASLNFAVGALNMLPLLPLDGGHVAIVLFEQARRRVYRVFGRRDPGRVDIMKIMPVTYAVFAAFVGVSLLLLYAGIVNPISIQ